MARSNQPFSYTLPGSDTKGHEAWEEQIKQVTQRFNREYQGQAVELPEEIEAMPIFQAWQSGSLTSQLSSPFWELTKPKKKQPCLDLGCGISFLIYPCWREWEAFFYGQDTSTVARDALMARGPQLNSKLFKGVELGAADQIAYDDNQFELAIATRLSCYYPMEYWEVVLQELKRVLKPGGQLIFDVANPELELTENWAILETYLGAEVFLEPLKAWEQQVKAAGGKIAAQKGGLIFQVYSVKF